MMNLFTILKMAPGFFYMLGSALLAAWSLDLIVDGVKHMLAGQGGAFSFFGGILGILVGVFLMFRYIYRFDRAKGRVKKKIKFFE